MKMAEEKEATTMPSKDGKAFLVTYNGEYQEVTVEAFDTKVLALEASGKSPKEKALVIQDATDLNQYDLKQLVDIYNGVNGTTLSRFRTLDSGKDRIITSIKGLAAAEGAVANGAGAASTEGEDNVPKNAVKKKAAPKPAGERKKRKSAIDTDKKIHRAESFKDYKLREGTSRAKDYARMTNGAKVSTYVDNKGSLNNIRFALKKKHITLE